MFMHTMISVQEKKEFIHWFLKNYQLKKLESRWILTYISQHRSVLRNTHFVLNANNCPRALFITAFCSLEPPFQFYKKPLMTKDPDKAFHDIRLNKDEPLFIQLNFHKKNQSYPYTAIIEDNPYDERNEVLEKEDRWIADQLLYDLLLQRQRKDLHKRIDQALDHKDAQTFLQLTNELLKLKKNKLTR